MNEAEQRIAEYERRMRELVENDPLFSIFMLADVDADDRRDGRKFVIARKEGGQGSGCPSRAWSDQTRKFASAAPRQYISVRNLPTLPPGNRKSRKNYNISWESRNYTVSFAFMLRALTEARDRSGSP
jgi:hypothetical protein